MWIETKKKRHSVDGVRGAKEKKPINTLNHFRPKKGIRKRMIE